MTATGITIGEQAPDFTLPNQDNVPVSLGDFRGRWVVLYFYPKDSTPGCTTEACDFTSGLKAFEALTATVLGVSADSPASHQKFIKKYDLKITLLSDPDHKMIAQYGAWAEKSFMGRIGLGIVRSTVLIDPQGNVARHWPKVSANGHAQEVQETLAKLVK